MRLVLFDAQRLGVLVDRGVVDVTHVLPWPHDTDPLTAGWWRELCRQQAQVIPLIAEAAEARMALALEDVRLLAPALNPSKIIAAAANYASHVEEMPRIQQRTLGRVDASQLDFDVFLKAPSSLVGPDDRIEIPAMLAGGDVEVHHEAELVAVVGKAGRDIPEGQAMEHVCGYMVGLDMTLRSHGDRSRRKSYDTFSPVGPHFTTADAIADPANLDISLTVNGHERQRTNTSNMLRSLPEIIAYSSAIMTLLPGDLIFTGAPPGVGPIAPGDHIVVQISGLGSMALDVVVRT